jgi:phosphate transport system substrate-binding protein
MDAGGSTFAYPMMSKWAGEYDKARGVQLNYVDNGSGLGIQQMIDKALDFGCTDGPMNDEELKKARVIGGEVVHIPLVLGAVVHAYHLEAVEQPLQLTGKALAEIFLGKITKWNDPAIRQHNPSAALPDLPIAVVHRVDSSGTTYIWIDYLSRVNPEWKTKVGFGKSIQWPCGLGENGDARVAGQVKRTAGAIG